MDKIELQVLGISTTTGTPTTFALILREIGGNRSIPIIIDAFGAQSIAFEIEKSVTPRPMTHDIMKTLIYSANMTLTEILISDVRDSTYFARMIFADDDIEIDCRPSDAIALALRCDAPIYTYSHILDEIGMFATMDNERNNDNDASHHTRGRTRLEQLQNQLDRAVRNENYEDAAKIRDQIKEITDSN
ncbi:MAG: bifunctional nuclease family protein [Ignavibacteria bacterium]|jgi:bifunctional DNase/RNase|nr:bifunctional nuclease family protein [Ignavibacteria bacterium]